MNLKEFSEEILVSPAGQVVRFDLDTVHRIPEFCVKDSLPTMRNLALISSGHELEYRRRFYEPNLAEWCERKKINYIIHFDKRFVDFQRVTNK